MDKRVKHSGSRVMSQRNSRASSRVGSSLSQGSRSFLGSRSSLFSSSRKSLASDSMRFQKQSPQILDEYGVDVTPVSLLLQDHPTTALKKQQSVFGAEPGTTPTAESSFQFSIYGTAGTGGTGFMQPFSKSMLGSSMTEGGTASIQGSMSDMLSAPSAATPMALTTQVQTIHEEVPEELSAEDLEMEVQIELTETETIWMLDIPGTSVAVDSDEAETVKSNNELYAELVKNRPGNDRYTECGMQTINDAPKIKQMQTDEVIMKTAGTFASTWDMYDTFEALNRAEKGEGGDDTDTLEGLSSKATSRMTSAATSRLQSRAPTAMGLSTIVSQEGDSTAGASLFGTTMMTEMSMYSGQVEGESKEGEVEVKMDPRQPNDHPILKDESLVGKLQIAERVVTQNIYQPKQALYRGLPLIRDPDSSLPVVESLSIHMPHLEKLWAYSCPLTRKRTVSSLAWNPANKDIVAVGYGDYGNSNKGPGLICCWSLKNPEHPERVFHASSGVTSVNFSQLHPNLLAAGLYDGTVVLYNVRSAAHEPALNSKDALHRHSGPVWQVSWVVKERFMGEDKAELLVSISADGRILQWSIRKGIESTQLMNLKRMVTPRPRHEKKTKVKHAASRSNAAAAAAASIGHGEAYISQHAPGMGFDFSPKDSNVYLACTEEGYIHKCSSSYNEQVLDTYTGHTGPVNRVLWSPFLSDVFLSCSADWSVRLWHQENTNPLHTFQAAQKSIYDVSWSPSNSTLFGCVSDGRVEIWNLEHSILDPLLAQSPISGARQTSIAFAHDTQAVLVGDSSGEVTVYFLRNVPPSPEDQERALLNIVNSVRGLPS